MENTELVTLTAGDILPEERSRLAALDSDSLRLELTAAMRVTAAHLIRLSWIVRLLEERGEDLSELHVGMLDYLRKIAHGQCLPEVVVRYVESPMLVQRISRLPLPDQRRLAAGEPVKLLVRSPSGEITHRQMNPLHLTLRQVHQVFAADKLRSDAEQVAWIEDKTVDTKKKKPRHGRIQADREQKSLRVGRVVLPVTDVLAALADLRSEETDAPTEESIVIRLTVEEHQRLRIKAAESGVSMTDLLRRAVRASGLV